MEYHQYMARVMRKGALGHFFQKVQPKTSRRVIDAAAGLGLHFLALVSARNTCFLRIQTAAKFVYGACEKQEQVKIDT